MDSGVVADCDDGDGDDGGALSCCPNTQGKRYEIFAVLTARQTDPLSLRYFVQPSLLYESHDLALMYRHLDQTE